MYQVGCKKSIVSQGSFPFKKVPISLSNNFVCSGSFNKKGNLDLWSVEGDAFDSLDNHSSEVDAVRFGHSKAQLVLATTCKDAVNIWNISQRSCTQLAKNLGHVSYLAFSSDDKFLIVCIQKELWVLDTIACKLVATVDIADGDIVCGEFLVTQPHLVIALTEGRTYNICDVNEQTVIYKSSIISSTASFLSLAIHPFEAFFATGSEDGMIRVFDSTLHDNILAFNVSTLMQKIQGEDDVGLSVVNLKYWNKRSLADNDEDYGNDVIKSVVNEELNLVVACLSSVLLLNGNSMEVLTVIMYSDIILENALCSLSTISNAAFGFNNKDFHIVLSSFFSNEIHICKLEKLEDSSSLPDLTVLSFEPLAENSPLKSEMQLKAPQSNNKTKKGTRKVDKLNQPLTFHQKIKSSGYTNNKPRCQMFQPNVYHKKVITSKNHVGPWGLKGEVKSLGKEYPVHSLPPTKLEFESKICVNETSINHIQFSDSGKSVVCALSDQSALLLKVPSMKSSVSFNGHNGIVNSSLMNHDNNIVITSSDDSTVKLWSPDLSEPLLDMSHYKHNFKKDSSGGTVENKRFTKTINRAQFYYNDKFVLLAYENSLLLYKYHIDQEKKNDVKRYLSNNKYKLVKDFQINESKQVTTFSAINSFYSYVAICACSNKELVIFDINKSQIIRTITEAHTRAVHSLCQNQGSSFVTQASEGYDLFVTAAITDGVKLWDLRMNRCICKFDSHLNRAHKVGLCYSPCSKYIVVGSEDNSFYVYDIRSVSYLHRISGQKDTVTALAFHPQYPIIASGTASGLLRTYKSE